MNRLGNIFLILICLSVCSAANAASLAVNGGFENVLPIHHDPAGYGEWFGNPAEMISSENGIVPTEGTKMLKYTGIVATTNVREWIDVSSLQFDSPVTLTADVYRISGASSTFLLTICDLNHAPVFSNSNPEYDSGMVTSSLVGVPADQWSTVSLSASVPPGTMTLGIEVSYMNLGGYSDNVRLTADVHATPEPSSLLLSTFGFLGLAAWRWRRRNRA